MDPQIIAAVLTIIASMYGMLKFMLRDLRNEVNLLKEDQKEFKQEIRFIHNRLDGLYRVLLDKTYGKNIPEDLK